MRGTCSGPRVSWRAQCGTWSRRTGTWVAHLVTLINIQSSIALRSACTRPSPSPHLELNRDRKYWICLASLHTDVTATERDTRRRNGDNQRKEKKRQESDSGHLVRVAARTDKTASRRCGDEMLNQLKTKGRRKDSTRGARLPLKK